MKNLLMINSENVYGFRIKHFFHLFVNEVDIIIGAIII